MKKIIKRTLLGIGILIVLVVVLFVWYGIKAKSETKMMNPSETGLMTDSIYSIKDSFVNLYLIKSGNNFVAIDAGNSVEAVIQGLNTLKFCPNNVVAILLTHTDGDHIAALKLFPKATVYISKEEEKMINGQVARFLFFGNSLNGRAYTTLEDNQEFNILNLKVKGILVPGHTVGSICYVVNDKYLFTGDALSLKNGKADRFNQFFNMDSEMAAKSMEKLTNLPNVKYIFTAHHGYTNDYNTNFK